MNYSLYWLQARIARKNAAKLTPACYTSAATLAVLDTNHPVAQVPAVPQQGTSFLQSLHSSINTDSAETNTPLPKAPAVPSEDAAHLDPDSLHPQPPPHCSRFHCTALGAKGNYFLKLPCLCCWFRFTLYFPSQDRLETGNLNAHPYQTPLRSLSNGQQNSGPDHSGIQSIPGIFRCVLIQVFECDLA